MDSEESKDQTENTPQLEGKIEKEEEEEENEIEETEEQRTIAPPSAPTKEATEHLANELKRILAADPQKDGISYELISLISF